MNEPAPVLTVAPALGRAAGAIAIHGLTVRFADLLAVDDVSLSIAESVFLSIVGPSGCGKTTILNVLAGLIDEHQGRVTVAGREPAVGDPATGYMLARDSLLPWRTTLANVCYGMEVRGIGGADREQLAHEQLERVGLGKFAHAYPKMLSHGMRQRCALAIARSSMQSRCGPWTALLSRRSPKRRACRSTASGSKHRLRQPQHA